MQAREGLFFGARPRQKAYQESRERRRRERRKFGDVGTENMGKSPQKVQVPPRSQIFGGFSVTFGVDSEYAVRKTLAYRNLELRSIQRFSFKVHADPKF